MGKDDYVTRSRMQKAVGAEDQRASVMKEFRVKEHTARCGIDTYNRLLAAETRRDPGEINHCERELGDILIGKEREILTGISDRRGCIWIWEGTQRLEE